MHMHDMDGWKGKTYTALLESLIMFSICWLGPRMLYQVTCSAASKTDKVAVNHRSFQNSSSTMKLEEDF